MVPFKFCFDTPALLRIRRRFAAARLPGGGDGTETCVLLLDVRDDLALLKRSGLFVIKNTTRARTLAARPTAMCYRNYNSDTGLYFLQP